MAATEGVSKFLGRKFLLTIYVLVLGPVFLWFDKIDGGTFVALVGTVVGLFSASDAYITGKALTGGSAP